MVRPRPATEGRQRRRPRPSAAHRGVGQAARSRCQRPRLRATGPADVTHRRMSDTAGDEPSEGASTLYQRVGGAAWFEALTGRFYAAVASDPILRPVYPDDLAAAQD